MSEEQKAAWEAARTLQHIGGLSRSKWVKQECERASKLIYATFGNPPTPITSAGGNYFDLHNQANTRALSQRPDTAGWQLVPEIRAPGLDPIQVFIHDEAPGAGRLVVQCYGSAWTAYWGAMGDRTVSKFIQTSGADYIASKLHTYLPGTDETEESALAYLTRIVQAIQSALPAAPQPPKDET